METRATTPGISTKMNAEEKLEWVHRALDLCGVAMLTPPGLIEGKYQDASHWISIMTRQILAGTNVEAGLAAAEIQDCEKAQEREGFDYVMNLPREEKESHVRSHLLTTTYVMKASKIADLLVRCYMHGVNPVKTWTDDELNRFVFNIKYRSSSQHENINRVLTGNLGVSF